MLFENKNAELLKLIESDPAKFLEEIDERKLCGYDSLFTEFFYSLLKSKGLTLKNLIYRTSISQSFIYQVASGRRRLGRDSALVLAFAMELDVEQTQRLLLYSCNAALYPSVRRDAIILCCLCQEMTYEEADEVLLACSEKGLV